MSWHNLQPSKQTHNRSLTVVLHHSPFEMGRERYGSGLRGRGREVRSRFGCGGWGAGQAGQERNKKATLRGSPSHTTTLIYLHLYAQPVLHCPYFALFVYPLIIIARSHRTHAASLRYIELDATKISGTMPRTFANPSDLRELELDDTLISGTIPRCVSAPCCHRSGSSLPYAHRR